jgi:hypothetical protein
MQETTNIFGHFSGNHLLKEFFMDSSIKKWWLNVSEARLRNALAAQKLPPAIVGQLVARVQELKAERRKARIKATTAANSWDAILASARLERQSVHVRKTQTKQQKPFVQDKWDALCAYEAVITSVIEKLAKVQRNSTHTPKQFVDFIKEETGRVIPNGGMHWADYVKASDRQRVILIFDALPPPTRGKRKTPFVRRMTPTARKAQAKVLSDRLAVEVAGAEREYKVTNDPEVKQELNAQIQAMYKAQFILHNQPPAMLPLTWHGLLK